MHVRNSGSKAKEICHIGLDKKNCQNAPLWRGQPNHGSGAKGGRILLF